MSNATMTAGKTAEAVIIRSDSNRVTIEITGSAFDNLKEIAAIHNSWNGEDLSPEEIVDRYLLDQTFKELPNKKASNPVFQTLCGNICGYFADVTAASSDEIKLLTNMFEAAGFDVQ